MESEQTTANPVGVKPKSKKQIQREREGQLVTVYHRMKEVAGKLVPAVGETHQLPCGTRYTVQEDGSIRRTDAKPYRNKAERKQLKRERIAARQNQNALAPA